MAVEVLVVTLRWLWRLQEDYRKIRALWLHHRVGYKCWTKSLSVHEQLCNFSSVSSFAKIYKINISCHIMKRSGIHSSGVLYWLTPQTRSDKLSMWDRKFNLYPTAVSLSILSAYNITEEKGKREDFSLHSAWCLVTLGVVLTLGSLLLHKALQENISTSTCRCAELCRPSYQHLVWAYSCCRSWQ